jgi:hypothetical protein
MKPCRGIHKISCERKSACPEGRKQVEPECIACSDAMLEVLDLEGKTIATHKAPQAKRAATKASKR